MTHAGPMPRSESEKTESARRARLFRNGRNQALRIPREFELAADEVIIHRDEDRLVLELARRSPSLAAVLATLAPLDEDFPRIADPGSEPEDIL